MLEVKPDQHHPLISDKKSRDLVFENLLAKATEAHHSMLNALTYPSKMRMAERLQIYRELALHYCAQEIINGSD